MEAPLIGRALPMHDALVTNGMRALLAGQLDAANRVVVELFDGSGVAANVRRVLLPASGAG